MTTISGFYKDFDGSLIDKDPESTLGYQIDWSEWLPSGDEVDTSTWAIETLEGDSDNLTTTGDTSNTTTTTITLTGGTTGKIYKVYNTITTVNGNTARRYFRVKIVERSL